MPTDSERGAAAWWRAASPAKRLSVLLVPVAVGVAGVVAFHVADARKRGESLWPVLLGLVVSTVVLSATIWFCSRPIAGLPPAEAVRTRSRRLMKWAAPIAIAIAVVVAVVQAVLSP